GEHAAERAHDLGPGQARDLDGHAFDLAQRLVVRQIADLACGFSHHDRFSFFVRALAAGSPIACGAKISSWRSAISMVTRSTLSRLAFSAAFSSASLAGLRSYFFNSFFPTLGEVAWP